MVGDTDFRDFFFYPQISQMGGNQFTLLVPCFACLFITQFNPHPASAHLPRSRRDQLSRSRLTKRFQSGVAA